MSGDSASHGQVLAGLTKARSPVIALDGKSARRDCQQPACGHPAAVPLRYAPGRAGFYSSPPRELRDEDPHCHPVALLRRTAMRIFREGLDDYAEL